MSKRQPTLQQQAMRARLSREARRDAQRENDRNRQMAQEAKYRKAARESRQR